MKRCVIVCASPDLRAQLVKSVISDGDYIIAADGGMKVLAELGIAPDLFVGDFDSYSGEVPETTEVIRLNVRKDDTDSMHCASVASEMDFSEIVFLGAVGGRLDHTFANFSTLAYLSQKGIRASIISEREEVRVLSEGEYLFENLGGCDFSVFPFACGSVTVSYFGEVEYPAENLTVKAEESIGVSNVFRSNSVKIKIISGRALVFNSFKK